MPRQHTTVHFSVGGISRHITLALDPAQMSQQFMLADFQRGQLYESETSKFFCTVLGPGDTFIDIGAHIGYFTLLASAMVGPTGRVYAFEPERGNFDHLVENMSLNALANIIPNHMAVGAKPSVASFFVNADNDGGHALWEVGRHPFNERTRRTPVSRKVALTSLDFYFAQHDLSSLKVLKIDAEGAELDILLGARGLLARYPVPFIVAEVNRFDLESMGASERQLRELVSAAGYETYLFEPGKSVLRRLRPDQTPKANHVFNLLFRHPSAP